MTKIRGKDRHPFCKAGFDQRKRKDGVSAAAVGSQFGRAKSADNRRWSGALHSGRDALSALSGRLFSTALRRRDLARNRRSRCRAKRPRVVAHHLLFGIGVEQCRRDGGQLEALLDDIDRDEEGRCDLLFVLAFLPHRLEGAKLIERVERCALDVLGEAVLFRQTMDAY